MERYLPPDIHLFFMRCYTPQKLSMRLPDFNRLVSLHSHHQVVSVVANWTHAKCKFSFRSYAVSCAIEKPHFIICIWNEDIGKTTGIYIYVYAQHIQYIHFRHGSIASDLRFVCICNWHKNEIIRIINLRRIFFWLFFVFDQVSLM